MEFGNFGGVFCQRSDLDSGKKIGVWKFGGVFCQRSDLDSGKKIGVCKFGGGCSANGQIWTQGTKLEFGNWGGGVFSTKFQNRVFLPIWSKNSGSQACLCITDSLSHTTYVETNENINTNFSEGIIQKQTQRSHSTRCRLDK